MSEDITHFPERSQADASASQAITALNLSGLVVSRLAVLFARLHTEGIVWQALHNARITEHDVQAALAAIEEWRKT